VTSQSNSQRQRLTAQTLERMKDGIRKRSDAIGRDHDRPFAEVGRMVAANRLARGMSQQELAILCGTTQSAIARLERGGRAPQIDKTIGVGDTLESELLLEMRLREPSTE
jgi:ribosome-binding protein aMBF1 (putative translation factor)